jgi:hypothetical protein
LYKELSLKVLPKFDQKTRNAHFPAGDVRINANARLLSPTAISQKYLDSNGSKNFSF